MLAGGVLVGRDTELAVLDALITQTTAGTGGVVLLAGEPGVGKTRLAREGTERAAGGTVLWGACRESEGAPPLWPWIQVLRGLGGERITADAGHGAAARFQLYERVGAMLAGVRQQPSRTWSSSTICTGPMRPRCGCWPI